MSELDHYLLRTERCLAQVHRHWAILAPQFGLIGLVSLGWLILLGASTSEVLRPVAWSFFLFSALWLTWVIADWRSELFAVTDKRVLMVSGLVTKRLAVMPLSKVTDMTYERSALGRALGYGTFIMESAGQDQALSRIDFVEHPERLYFQLSEELFGRDDWGARDGIAPRPPGRPAPPGRRAALRRDVRLPNFKLALDRLKRQRPGRRPAPDPPPPADSSRPGTGAGSGEGRDPQRASDPQRAGDPQPSGSPQHDPGSEREHDPDPRQASNARTTPLPPVR